jgi:hypothetical protein
MARPAATKIEAATSQSHSPRAAGGVEMATTAGREPGAAQLRVTAMEKPPVSPAS